MSMNNSYSNQDDLEIRKIYPEARDTWDTHAYIHTATLTNSCNTYTHS